MDEPTPEGCQPKRSGSLSGLVPEKVHGPGRMEQFRAEFKKLERPGAGRSENFAAGGAGKLAAQKVRSRALRRVAGSKNSLPFASARCRSKKLVAIRSGPLPMPKVRCRRRRLTSRTLRTVAGSGGSLPEAAASRKFKKLVAFPSGWKGIPKAGLASAPAGWRRVRQRTFRAGKLPPRPATNFSHRHFARAPSSEWFAPAHSFALCLRDFASCWDFAAPAGFRWSCSSGSTEVSWTYELARLHPRRSGHPGREAGGSRDETNIYIYDNCFFTSPYEKGSLWGSNPQSIASNATVTKSNPCLAPFAAQGSRFFTRPCS
jgi:hypothetical protein